tara:strand:+ start:507 stop:1553 length:1047 start_codon:yes stop_codon:yes gene_type:complete
MLVGLVDYFQIYLKGSSDGSRENGNDRYLTLFELGKSQDIIFDEYDKKKHDKYNLIIFKNEPRIQNIISILLRNIFKKKINIFYLADETPLSRKRISILIPFLYKRILINTFENNNSRKNFNHYFYTQPHIPRKEEIIKNKNFILKNNRKNLFCFVGSNVLSISDKGSYKFRHKILNGLSKFRNFSLYGRKWDQAVIPIDFPLLAIINRLPKIKNFILNFYKKKYPPIKNKGPIQNKINTLNDYNFALAIEPYIGEPRMLLEKIFDPMLCGSIPVYYGPEGLDIPNNIYIRINENVVAENLIKYLESFDESELVEYRTRIYNFLLSNEAERYRNEYWAKEILNIIKNH